MPMHASVCVCVRVSTRVFIQGTNVSYCDLEGNPTSVSFADSTRVAVVSSGGPSERSTPPESSAPCSDDDDDDLFENAGPIPHAVRDRRVTPSGVA